MLILPQDKNKDVLSITDLPTAYLLYLLETVKEYNIIIHDSVVQAQDSSAAKSVLHIASHSSAQIFPEPKHDLANKFYMVSWSCHNLEDAWCCLEEISKRLKMKVYLKLQHQAKKVKRLTRRPGSLMQSCSVSWIVFCFCFCFLVYIQPLWFLHSIGPSP